MPFGIGARLHEASRTRDNLPAKEITWIYPGGSGSPRHWERRRGRRSSLPSSMRMTQCATRAGSFIGWDDLAGHRLDLRARPVR
jgi:hypothetical protein